jgi:hypothetical protein
MSNKQGVTFGQEQRKQRVKRRNGKRKCMPHNNQTQENISKGGMLLESYVGLNIQGERGSRMTEKAKMDSSHSSMLHVPKVCSIDTMRKRTAFGPVVE